MKHNWVPHPKWSMAYRNWFICKNCGREHQSKIIPSVLPQDECLGARQKIPGKEGR